MACSPTTPIIRARIPLNTTIFQKNGNKQEEAGDGPFLKTHEDISLKAAAAAANLSTLFTVRRT